MVDPVATSAADRIVNLIYFDEAKDDAEYPKYHIGAICVADTDLHKVESRVDAIARDTFGTSELGPGTELHAAEIYHRKANFKEWTDFERRISVLAQLLEVLSMDEVSLIEIQINCDLLHDSQSPSDIAFMFLCERANDLMKARDTIGMLIGDRESDRLAGRYATTLSEYRVQGTGFAFGRDIHNLIDSVHFTHSHLSRFLQLADIYTWVLQFQTRNRGSDNFRHQAMFAALQREGVNLFASKYKVWPKRSVTGA